MTFGSVWWKPQHRLLVALGLTAAVSIGSLGWLGWRLLVQERMLDAQRAQQRVEEAADRITAAIRRSLSETSERMPHWAVRTPDRLPGNGLLLVFAARSLQPVAGPPLLFAPTPSDAPEAPARSFAEAEVIEYLQGQPRLAAEAYRRMAESGPPAVRAGALLRLSRVLRKLGNREQLAEVYRRLAQVQGARLLGVPSELVALHAQCTLGGGDAAALRRDLLAGRWRLTRGQFDYYWAEAARLTGIPDPPPAGGIALADAVSQLWTAWPQTLTGDHGQTLTFAQQQTFVVLSRGNRQAVLIMPAAALLAEAATRERYQCALFGADGRLLAGERGEGRPSIRPAAEFDLPWSLSVWGHFRRDEAQLTARRRFLALGMLLVLLVLAAGSYFTAAAVRKEIEISRLQSDFVAAVSHEFRSPLTSLRQLSEILVDGRVPNEERRQLYYETLLSETGRLQRLVESLLTFGRLEAGAGPRRFEVLNLTELVSEVVKGFSSDRAHSQGNIFTDGPESCPVYADHDTLAVALRNLIDNALKYSPEVHSAWVEWGSDAQGVFLRVRDRGAGIPAGERKKIFAKFVRGTAARTGNVKGTGVGLAMVRQIVAAHSGRIRLESEPGKGSTFTILIPREIPS